MYWSNQEVDTRTYSALCPSCNASRWLDFDWETGLGPSRLCGWNPDNMPPFVGGGVVPSQIVSRELPLDGAPNAYDKFDKRVDG